MPARHLGHKHTIEGLDIYTTAAPVTGEVLYVADTSGNLGHAPWIDLAEISAPAAPAGNTARLYARDNGAGKTELVVLFPTGAALVIKTEV